ncbi:MAG: AraC family transcriptional regulator [Bacteroidota bacterium]
MLLPANYRRGAALGTLVENRTTYGLQAAEMNIFETHQATESVLLDFDQPALASMIQGKKVMHLRDKAPFAFLPGESVMLPPGELMCIDFPDATPEAPTKCLALVVDEEKIAHVSERLNHQREKLDDREWQAADYNFHFTNDVAVHQIIQRLVFLCAEDHPAKDLFVGNMLDELIVRIMEAENRYSLLHGKKKAPSNDRLSFVINYIRDNLSRKLSVRQLSQQAYMSESHFHRAFKNELGCSPVDFINEERLQLAARLLHDPARDMTQVALECGFNSLSYFTRRFKRRFGECPSAYQKRVRLTSKD